MRRYAWSINVRVNNQIHIGQLNGSNDGWGKFHMYELQFVPDID